MIIYGRNTIIEALRSSFQINKIYLEKEIHHDEKILEIIKLSKDKLEFKSRKEIEKISQSYETQGIACDVNFKLGDISEIDYENNKSFIYISESTFEQNVGAIVRTAECAGFSGVILPSDVKITPAIAKISTGAIFHIPIYSLSIYQAVDRFKKNGYKIFGIERGGKKYSDVDLPLQSLLIIGGENKSLSDNIKDKCDEILSIPQFGLINSLNMSNASAIVIYELIRQNYN